MEKAISYLMDIGWKMREFNRYILQVPKHSIEKFYSLMKNFDVKALIVRDHGENAELDFQTGLNCEVVVNRLLEEGVSITFTLVEDPAPTTDLIRRTRILDEAAYLINIGDYWRAHVLLEAIWKPEVNHAKKNFFRGMILLCASQVKEQMNQHDISKKLYAQAIDMIENYGISAINGDIASHNYTYPLRIKTLAFRRCLP